MVRYYHLLAAIIVFGVASLNAQTLISGDVMTLSSNSYLKAANFANVGTGAFTIEGWVKTSGTATFVSNRDCDSHGNFFTFYVGSTLTLEIDEDAGGTNYAVASGSGSVTNGAWHHVAVVRSGTTVKFYIDGALDATVTTSGVANINNSYPLFIGARGVGSGGVGEYLTGSLDDVRIWSVARTAGEISGNKDAYISASTPGLMANYRFDEGTGTTTADATTNAHTLDLIGAGAQFLTTTLPVELESFTGLRSGSSVLLRWSTATEVNNHGFTVERMNGGTWTALTFVHGQGSTNVRTEYSYTDATAPSAAVQYRLKQTDRDGSVHYSPIVEAASSVAPLELLLDQNYPNPFNPTTAISYQVSATGMVKLSITDALGREVAVLLHETKEPGAYTARWDAARFASGIYFARLQSGSRTLTRKLLLMK